MNTKVTISKIMKPQSNGPLQNLRSNLNKFIKASIEFPICKKKTKQVGKLSNPKQSGSPENITKPVPIANPIDTKVNKRLKVIQDFLCLVIKIS